MANTITTQTIVNGDRVLVLKVHISADTTAEYTDQVLVDASAFNTSDMKIVTIEPTLDGFSAVLRWDATANVDILSITSTTDPLDFSKIGGLVNNAGAGKTGDILISTSGLGAGDSGTLVMRLTKREAT